MTDINNSDKPLSVAELDEKTAALETTMTPAKQERAKSLWDEIVEVQGVGGGWTARRDWLDCIEQTISERNDPKPPLTPEDIRRTVDAVHGRRG